MMESFASWLPLIGLTAQLAGMSALMLMCRRGRLLWSSWAEAYFTLWDELETIRDNKIALNTINQFFDDKMQPRLNFKKLEQVRAERRRARGVRSWWTTNDVH